VSASALADQAARDRIRAETGSNLFVEAGAGSGKTRSLVGRVTQLVLHDADPVPLRHVAAVTFTEKAGAELRDRLRANFERERRQANEREQHERASEALEDLDSAAIGTLHSFAQRILSQHPIEAGLPPLVEVLDEVASSVAFEERWSVMQKELLESDELAEALLLALSAGVKLEHLRSLTRAFGADWDLIRDRVQEEPARVNLPEVAELAAEAFRLAARADGCRKDDDKFLPRLAALAVWGESLSTAADDRSRFAALLAAQDLKFAHGQKPNWPDLAALKAECQDLQQRADEAAAVFTEATLRPLAHWIARQVEAAAKARAAEGRLEFHDLLVLARDLLRNHAETREALQKQYPRLLLDEFQDTDPIQIELAVRIAGGREADATDWRDIVLPPGSLFVVGDPKQSIYRFRRASISLYLETSEWFSAEDRVTLNTNFRTVDPVLGWVNQVFAEIIQHEPNVQPTYVPLLSHRTEAPPTGPAVVVLGRDEHPEKHTADELRALEADDVAAAITQALIDQWTVWDETRKTWRPIRLVDIAVLIPSRISLGALETAFDSANVPYRAESSSLVYQASEVRELLMAAQAIADPSDQFACVMALRSPLFGCGDDDLWTWKQAHGSFHVLAPTEDTVARLDSPTPHSVAQALGYLRGLHRRARWMSPSEVLGALVAERLMLEVAVGGSRPRDTWRRLRFVIDQARAWSEVEHGGLRSYLVWAAKQGEDTSRVAEAVLPETDVDAVRIMTIHGAKGLEFPMVVLSGMSTNPRVQRGVQLLWTDAGYAVHLVGAMQTNDFKDAAPVDEQMDAHERRRLLYVAATRARDHLVVSLHRCPGGSVTNARLMADVGGTEAGAVAFEAGSSQALPDARPTVSPPPHLAAWQERMAGVRAATARKPAQSASGLEGTEPEVVLTADPSLAAGEAKGGRDIDLPPWHKGRYGSAVGRAVHGVLQIVDLATGAGLDDAVDAQCQAEGVAQFTDEVRALVQSALASEIVQQAAARPHWRESYVGTADEDGTLIEGFVDLMYREDDGSLRVVDYKTDAIPAAAIPARAAFYQPQLDAYAKCVTKATGQPVHSTLLFLSTEPGKAVATP